VLETREAMLQKDSKRSPRIHVVVSGRCKSMSCNDIITTNFVRKLVNLGDYHGVPTSHDGSDAGVLVVSNSPEFWVPEEARQWDQPEKVYMCTIPLSSGPTPFRLFAWHVNSTPNQLKFSLRARLLNATKPDEVTFTDLRIERVSTLGANSGICLAKSHLFGPAGSTSSKNVLDEVDLVEAQTVNASTGFMGLLVTANIDAPNACTLQLRCVVHPTSSGPGTNWSTVTCARKLIGDEESTVDVRGWWPRTGARFSRPENDPFDVSQRRQGTRGE
jgi:hypothetical protein